MYTSYCTIIDYSLTILYYSLECKKITSRIERFEDDGGGDNGEGGYSEKFCED